MVTMPDVDYFEATAPWERGLRTWKAVWSNGDEVYVVARGRRAAQEAAWRKHGESAARLVYLQPSGRAQR